jgi:hypothetical protein
VKLDTVQRIERFISDALLSSNLIPLGVNVVRLAAEQDTEGITAMARSIVVRYLGSDVSVQQRRPMVIERTMKFEIIHSAQSYLTESGHDYAVQMCSGAYLTLNNHVPMNTGVQIIEPLHMVNENFDGLTDSSHYVYTQQWQLTAHEIYHLHAVDPCVERGNCTYLFPDNTLNAIEEGEVLVGNVLWAPVARPHELLDPNVSNPGDPLNPGEVRPILTPAPTDYETDGGAYLKDACGVVERDGDLYYKFDPSRLFLSNWEDFNLTSTGQMDESGQFLVCSVRRKTDGELVMVYYASNCQNRKLVFIGGTLGASPMGRVGNCTDSSSVELFGTTASLNEFGYSICTRSTIYADPTSPDTETAQIRYGVVYSVQSGVILKHGEEKYYYIGGTVLGRAWVNVNDFKILNRRSTLDLDCELDTLYPGTVPCED